MTQHNMEGAAMNAQNNTGDNTAQNEQEHRSHPCGEPSPTRELYKKLGHIGRLTHMWAAQQRGRTGLGRIDTTRGQGRILAALKLKDGIATRELAYVLGIRVPSLNEALSKLENAGHIVREPDPRDRRVQLITLTDSGRALTGQLGEGEPEGDNIFEVLTEQERANLSDYLDKLIARMHEDLPDLEAGRQEWEKAARARMGMMRLKRGRHKPKNAAGSVLWLALVRWVDLGPVSGLRVLAARALAVAASAVATVAPNLAVNVASSPRGLKVGITAALHRGHLG